MITPEPPRSAPQSPLSPPLAPQSHAPIPTQDLQLLRDYLHKQIHACLHEPEGLLKYWFLTPTAGTIPGADDEADIPARSLAGIYNQMYDWDACFLSQTAARYGLFDVRLDIIKSFLSLQQASGYVPRTVSPGRIWDNGDMCKPFLCQTLLSRPSLNSTDIADIMPALRNYLSYYIAFRRHSSQLFCWRNMLESGIDNNLALIAPEEAAKGHNTGVGDFEEPNILAVDLNCYLIKEFEAFSQLAQKCDCRNLATQFEHMSETLKEMLETLLWNEDLGMYANLPAFDNTPVMVRSWTGLLPALLDICDRQRAKKIIEGTILNTSHFWRPAGVSSTAASEILYNNAPRGLYGQIIVSNWQGPMWILPNILTARCLVAHGYIDPARDLAARVLRTMIAGLRSTNTTYENYNAETGAPLWAPNFISWNSMALELIDLLC